jgi:hypothetical protein
MVPQHSVFSKYTVQTHNSKTHIVYPYIQEEFTFNS